MSVQEDRFSQIAAAIREKDGTDAPIRALDFADRIRAIPTSTDPEGLPSGYTELEYISSDGTQYVNTWFYPTPKTRVVADVELPAYSAAMYPFGTRSEAVTTAAQQLMVGYVAANRLRYFYFGTYKNFNVTSLSGRITIDANKNVLSVGSQSVTMDGTTLTGPTSYPIFLFAYNNIGRAAGYSSCQMYSCKIYDDDILKMDFVPCKNPSGVVGLYDVVSRNFFGSFWTGEFIAGPTV